MTKRLAAEAKVPTHSAERLAEVRAPVGAPLYAARVAASMSRSSTTIPPGVPQSALVALQVGVGNRVVARLVGGAPAASGATLEEQAKAIVERIANLRTGTGAAAELGEAVGAGEVAAMAGVGILIVSAAVGWIAFNLKVQDEWRRHFDELALRLAIIRNLREQHLITDEDAETFWRSGHLKITYGVSTDRTEATAAVKSESSSEAKKGAAPAKRKRDTAAAQRFLRAQLAILRDRHRLAAARHDEGLRHPCDFLIVEVASKLGEPNAEPTKASNSAAKVDWRKTERVTEKGTTQTGRYEGNEEGPTVQIGHKEAFAGGGKEVFMIEDADLNQLTGQTIETPGALSDKKAVDIEGLIVDLASAQQWVRLGLLDPGALANATAVE